MFISQNCGKRKMGNVFTTSKVSTGERTGVLGGLGTDGLTETDSTGVASQGPRGAVTVFGRR